MTGSEEERIHAGLEEDGGGSQVSSVRVALHSVHASSPSRGLVHSPARDGLCFFSSKLWTREPPPMKLQPLLSLSADPRCNRAGT